MRFFQNLHLRQHICYDETATVSVFVYAAMTHNIMGHPLKEDQAFTSTLRVQKKCANG